MAPERLPHLAALLALTTLMVAAPARAAQPDPAERAVARRLMDEGDRQADVKDYRGALASYQKADAIMGVPTTGIDVAKTHLALGHLVEAWQVAVEVTRFPRKPAESEAFTRARVEADTLIEAVLPRIPTLRLSVDSAPPGAPIAVTIDDVPVPAASLTSPQKINPGHHRVRATARGFAPASDAIDLVEGQTTAVHLTLTPSKYAEGEGRLTPLVLGGFGLGAAGIVVGSITGVLSLGAVSRAKKVCTADGRCPPSAQPDLDQAATFATVSDIGFGAALVGVGVGIVGLVIAPRPASSAATSPPFGVTLAPIANGAAIRGWF